MIESTEKSRRILRGRAPGLGIVLLLWLIAAAVPSAAQELRLDPAKVKGPDACGECHKSSVAAWKLTLHATSFKTVPRSKKAKKILAALGLKRMKVNVCLTCHFTSAVVNDKVKPIAGTTCESCHGAGADWIKEHGDYGGKDVKRENEPAEHKRERLAKAEAAGMIRPDRLYDVAANCYGCHTVPNEKLVNTGGHPAGSKFELVSWTQGEVRHNVWYTKENREASIERKRMMYIVGKALDLEHALRGVAKATKKATYAKAMARRASAAKKGLKAIAAKVKVPEIEAIVAAAAGAKLKLNNADQLNSAADKVAAAARKLAQDHDGSQFAAIDSLIPGAGDYKGQAVP